MAFEIHGPQSAPLSPRPFSRLCLQGAPSGESATCGAVRDGVSQCVLVGGGHQDSRGGTGTPLPHLVSESCGLPFQESL